MPFLGRTPTQLVDPEVDINGGAIDGVTIGATSASPATVTTFTSTGIDDNADATAITIDSSERLGVGTTSPNEKLHVYTTSDARVEIESTTGLAAFKATNNQGSYAWYLDSAADKFHLYDFTDAANRLTIDGNGNVGIGTTSPQNNSGRTTLTLSNATNGGILEIFGPSATRQLLIYNDTGESRFETLAGGSEDIVFRPNGNEAVRIDSSGNIGIGTTSPNYKLDVVGAIRATNSGGSTIIANRTSNPGSFELQYDGTQTAQFSALSGGGVVTYTGSTPTERMRIDSSGNVGIGIASPAGPLHIQSATNRTIILDATFASGSFTWQSVRRSGSEKFRWFINADDSMSIYSDAGSTYSMTWNTAGDAGLTGSDTPSNVSSYRSLELGQLNASKRGRLKFNTNNGGITLYSFEQASRPYLGIYSDANSGTYIGRFDDEGLKFGSDTAAANALDDYEEGTFTPGFIYSAGNGNASFTFSNATGRYTKIGNICYFSIDLRFNSFSKGTASGIPQLRDLPFTPANYSNYNRPTAALYLYQYPYATTAGYIPRGVVYQNGSTNRIDLQFSVSNGGATNLTDPDSNSMIFASGFYYTT